MSYMQQALELASQALGTTSPNPSVGAVLVKDGQVVGKGFTRPLGGPHAEVGALQQAGPRARGAVLYTTLEPCCHYGRTGPCTQAIVAAGVSQVHMATLDPNPRVNGAGRAALEASGVQTFMGEEEAKARELVEAYARWITTGLPFVTAKYAMTLDGKIATVSGESRWITGEEARRFVHRLRKESDAVMVGIGTALRDDPQLTARDEGGSLLSQQPLRVIVDSQGRLPPTALVLSQPGETLVAVAAVPAQQREVLERGAGAQMVAVPAEDGRVDLRSLLRLLGEREVTSVLVEGGGTLLGSLFQERLIDKVVAFIGPLVVGGRDAPTPVEGSGVRRLADALRLGRLQLLRFGDDVCILGYPDVAGG